MARIPQKFIDDLLDRIDLVEVIDRRVKLRKQGKNYTACCPFHDEKTPSFSVNPEKQFFYCFGCGAGGNALGFLMDYERLEFPQAIEQLAQSAGMEVPREEGRAGGNEAKQESHRALYAQLEEAAVFYEQALRKHHDAPKAIDYLKKRGLTGQIAKLFRIGYAPAGWDNLSSALGHSEQQRALLKEGGMLVSNDKGRTYDRFRDRIIFPILDARGRVIAFGGRVLGNDKPKYLNSPETPVFHKSRELYGLYQARKAHRSLTRIVVVEGYMDVIALAQHDIHYAVATLGTATSEHHLERLFRQVSEVVFCFDGDDAGRKAAFRALEASLPVMQDGRQARFLFLPEGEDPDSLVRHKGKAHLEHLFDTAAPLEQFLFQELATGINLQTLDGKARYSKIVAPHLRQLPQGVFRTLMYQELANRTGIDMDSLLRLQTPSEPPQYGSAPTGAEVAAYDPPATTAPNDPQAMSDYEQLAYERTEPDPSEGDGARLPPDAGLMDDSLLPAQNNPIHRLLGLLVLRPKFAALVTTSALPEATRRDLRLLHELVQHLQETPDATTAALLGFWYGTPEGQLLADLAGRETLEDEAGQEALFLALLAQQQREIALGQHRARLSELKAMPYTSLSQAEKKELLTLTANIRALIARR